MKQELQSARSEINIEDGWIIFYLSPNPLACSKLIVMQNERRIDYFTVEPYLIVSINMTDAFDCSSLNNVIESLMLFHSDFLKMHGITIPAYDYPKDESIELPPEL